MITPEAIAARTAKAAATRARNAREKIEYDARTAAYEALRKKIKAMADDERGNENVRAVAAIKLKQVKRQQCPWEARYAPFPRTAAEWEAAREAVKLARKVKRAAMKAKRENETTAIKTA